MIYDIQQLIEKCTICQEYGKSQLLIGTTQELPPFPWHTLATVLFYWKSMDFLIVADVFSKYILVRKLPNSTSAAVCIELSMIVTELGLPHIIRSDNSLCYNSKEFQQCSRITHQTSSPNHPRSNGFVERMAGVAKKLMDKAGKEGKPWISGLFDYWITPQSGSIASPLQLMTQHTPREKNLPQLPSALGAPEMDQTHQELIKRQGNNSKPERKYQELFPGTPVWVQHKQNATWEPAIVVNQCAPNSYWIMQENGAEQPRVLKMLKIRSTPTDGEQKAQMREWSTETDNAKFHIPAIPYGNRNITVKNSQGHSLPSGPALPLPSLDLPESEFFSENREESQIAEPQLCTSGTTLGNAPDAPIAPGT